MAAQQQPTIYAPKEGGASRAEFSTGRKKIYLYKTIASAAILLALVVSLFIPFFSVTAKLSNSSGEVCYDKTYRFSMMDTVLSMIELDDYPRQDVAEDVQNLKSVTGWNVGHYAVNMQLYLNAVETDKWSQQQIDEFVKVVELFSQDIEKRNADGLQAFIMGYYLLDEVTADKVAELADTYLVGKYTVDEDFMTRVEDINLIVDLPDTLILWAEVQTINPDGTYRTESIVNTYAFYTARTATADARYDTAYRITVTPGFAIDSLCLGFFLTAGFAVIALIMLIVNLVGWLTDPKKVQRATAGGYVFVALLSVLAPIIAGAAGSFLGSRCGLDLNVVCIIALAIFAAIAVGTGILVGKANKVFDAMQPQFSAETEKKA